MTEGESIDVDQITVGDHVTWVNAWGDKDDYYHAVIREIRPYGKDSAVVCEAALYPGKRRTFQRWSGTLRWRCGRFWMVKGWV